MQESEEDDTEIRPDGSRFLRHFGAVTPNRRPEDFKALRDAFEQGVADEVRAEIGRENQG